MHRSLSPSSSIASFTARSTAAVEALVSPSPSSSTGRDSLALTTGRDSLLSERLSAVSTSRVEATLRSLQLEKVSSSTMDVYHHLFSSSTTSQGNPLAYRYYFLTSFVSLFPFLHLVCALAVEKGGSTATFKRSGYAT